MSIHVFSDGASRGNPGVSAIAYMILRADGHLLARHSQYVGVRTNNQAEYEAVIAALEAALTLHVQEVVCHLDSELVVKQLTGEYRVRNQALRRLWLRVHDLKPRFRQITFKHVSRGDRYLEDVDRLANQTLDRVQQNV